MSSDVTSLNPEAADALAKISGTTLILTAVICVFSIIVFWKIFKKANEPGWAAIVPFYNQYVLAKIVFGNGWLFLLYLVPIVGFFYHIILMFKLATVFGKGAGFGFGTLILPIIFAPILAFGSAEYVGIQK